MVIKRILVTGGAGFIGSHLCERLLIDKANDVICLDNFDDFYDPKVKMSNISSLIGNNRFKILPIDIRNGTLLEDSIDMKIDIIIHLAAKAGVIPSIENPHLYTDVNIRGTENLLEFAKNKKISKFIFASSSSVYGVNSNIPWKEDENVTMPISPYAFTKVSSEVLGHVYNSLYCINFIALRFFTVYGPRQRPDLAIYKFFKSIYFDIPITIYGNGNTSRDYTFIDDAINGIINALSYDKTHYEIFNIGNSKTFTLQELVKLIEEVTEKNAIIIYKSEMLGDVPKTFANISKSRANLNYRPRTSLKEGLIEFNNWFKKYCI
jgi:UDP-glucuronate 4-epimerase